MNFVQLFDCCSEITEMDIKEHQQHKWIEIQSIEAIPLIQTNSEEIFNSEENYNRKENLPEIHWEIEKKNFFSYDLIWFDFVLHLLILI